MRKLKPLFTAEGVPDDEILLAEAIAEIELRNMLPGQGSRSVYAHIPSREDEFADRCCVLGALDRSRMREIDVEELPGAISGNDGWDEEQGPFYDLGMAFYSSKDAK